jgi:hypothetical protein
MQQTPARAALSCLVQKTGLKGIVYDNKKGVVGRLSINAGYCFSYMQELEKVCDMMFPVTLYQRNINTHFDATGFDVFVRYLQDTKPRYNLSGAERRALRSLRTNSALTVIHADKGNVTLVLDTMYYEKISALLRAPTYRRLAKDPTDAVERKTNLLLRKSSLPEEVI